MQGPQGFFARSLVPMAAVAPIVPVVAVTSRVTPRPIIIVARTIGSRIPIVAIGIVIGVTVVAVPVAMPMVATSTVVDKLTDCRTNDRTT